jgi:CO/xanthine dehydrogenase Mo-binding subunit
MPILHVEKQASEEGDDKALKVVESSGLAPWNAGAQFSVVGQRHPRVEGSEKVTGRAQYTYDIQLPGQLYTRVLRSPLPHARIIRVDTSRAEALPGVHAVLSSASALEISWYEESKLFDQTVRFVGDEIAAVAAESEEIAEDALRLIEVEYEPLPFVLDIEAALLPQAPHLYEPGNIAGEPQSYERGDVAAGFSAADVLIERAYTTQTALHNSLEPHGCTAAWESDRLTLYSSTQGIFAVRKEVAKKLKLPEHHVRVITQHMGGGFGAKQIAWKQDVIAALLARQAGWPVQLMLDRESENLAVGNRNATRQHVRIGAKRDGTITAIDVRVELQNGAYQVGGEASDVSGIYQTLYRCANVRTEQVAVYTNTGPAVAFRAPGYVEGAFALESAIDELAEALGLDPIELRLRNYTEHDQQQDKPYTRPESLRRCYERVAETVGWHDRQRAPQTESKRRGIGFAAHNWVGGSGKPPGYAWVKLNHDGSVEVITGAQDIGTGTRTGLTQIAAEELGLPIEHVTLYLGDTVHGPYAPTSAGSMTLATLAPAVRAAAADAKRQICAAAAPILEEQSGSLVVRDGQVAVVGEPERTISVAEVCGRIAPHMIQGQGARGPNPEDQSVHTVGAQCAEVEVDLETGEVTLLRVVAAHDCGRIINPTMVDSQVIGGATQGIGFALTEERVVDARSGVVLNANLEEYKIPTVADVPEIIHARLDLPDVAANPTGAKGIGEPPIIPTAPAIVNAVFDAIGVRIRHIPLTRQRLLEALAEHAQQQRQGDEHATI